VLKIEEFEFHHPRSLLFLRDSLGAFCCSSLDCLLILTEEPKESPILYLKKHDVILVTSITDILDDNVGF
jgi:hypothetical protein